MKNLRELVISSSSWIFTGYFIGQILRLCSNLLITRILMPEIFGLSALINTFIVGLSMFSDLGIGPSIIQDKKGDDPTFLNTAWTIQILRGTALWVCSCIGAWPFASFYGEPRLALLIPISGLTALIAGFNSTGIFTQTRQLILRRLTLIDIGTQIVSTIVIICWALISPTIWAMIAGSLVGAFIRSILSHVWLSEIKHRLIWDKQSAKSLIKFGRWIFLSTILTFLAQYMDRLVFGKFLTLDKLGIYSIAAMIVKSPQGLFSKLSSRVIFPLYSKLKERPEKEFRRKVLRLRYRLTPVFLIPLYILVLFGQDIIQFLLDDRYVEAGWMLQILAVGSIVALGTALGPVTLAFGDSYQQMKLMLYKTCTLLVSMIIGGVFWGATGVIVGVACSNVFYYPFQSVVYKRYGVWFPVFDVLLVFTPLIVTISCLYLL